MTSLLGVRPVAGGSKAKLPPPGEHLEWKAVPSFNAADEVMRDPGLKDLFMKAMEEGCAICGAAAVGRLIATIWQSPSER